MKRICFTALIYAALLLLSSVSSQRSRIKTKLYAVGQGYQNRPSYSFRRSGISGRRMSILFPTAAALGGIYIASRMRPHVRLRSYHDLNGYTVCEGYKSFTENNTAINYKYFLCPDDINQPFERYCCLNDNGTGMCCSYDQKSNHYLRTSGNIIGSVAGVIIFLLLTGTLFYCCCYRNRRSRKTPANTAAFITPATDIPIGDQYGQTNVGQPQTSVPPYPGSYPPPYPSPPAPMPKGSGLSYPAPDAYPTSLYPPQAPSAGMVSGGAAPQPPAISSGWGAAPDTRTAKAPSPGGFVAGGVLTSGYEAPPPPYSAAVGTTPYPPP